MDIAYLTRHEINGHLLGNWIARDMDITKIGLAAIHEGAILLVKKRRSHHYILPGGKPESNERDYEALSREVREELCCEIAPQSLVWLGVFRDNAAGMPGVFVTIKLYRGQIIGDPTPANEIESFGWFKPQELIPEKIAPSLRNSILPYLFGPSTQTR